MTGVAVYLVIGLVLFIPMGFLIGFIQDQRQKTLEKENMETPRSDTEDKNEY